MIDPNLIEQIQALFIMVSPLGLAMMFAAPMRETRAKARPKPKPKQKTVKAKKRLKSKPKKQKSKKRAKPQTFTIQDQLEYQRYIHGRDGNKPELWTTNIPQ